MTILKVFGRPLLHTHGMHVCTYVCLQNASTSIRPEVEQYNSHSLRCVRTCGVSNMYLWAVKLRRADKLQFPGGVGCGIRELPRTHFCVIGKISGTVRPHCMCRHVFRSYTQDH